jgi:phosphoglycerate dehydrogenase-like enzyme
MQRSGRSHILVSDALDPIQMEEIEKIIDMSSGQWSLLKANAQTDIGNLPLADIDVIYISVDVLGESSKMQLTPLMSVFCDVALSSPNLQWLQASSAGMDRPQYQALRKRGVTLTHAGGIASTAVAHSAIAGLLALGRGLPKFMALQKMGRWLPERGSNAPREIPGQTAVIVGLGAIGQEIARLCDSLGLGVLGFNRSGVCPPSLDIEVLRVSEFDHFLGRADWVILSCPLTEETRHFVAERHFHEMKKSAYLIDVSRGGVVNSAHLLAALQQGNLAGAYLDVFETEPLPPDSPFWALPNVIITPHSAGDFAGRGRNLTDLFIKNLRKYISGQPLINMLSREGRAN